MTGKGVLFTIAATLLCSCGSGMYVDLHYTTLERLQNMGGEGTNGFCKWNDVKMECDIYMLAPDEYDSEARYHEVLGHELRHCFEGDWHDE